MPMCKGKNRYICIYIYIHIVYVRGIYCEVKRDFLPFATAVACL